MIISWYDHDLRERRNGLIPTVKMIGRFPELWQNLYFGRKKFQPGRYHIYDTRSKKKAKIYSSLSPFMPEYSGHPKSSNANSATSKVRFSGVKQRHFFVVIL